MYLHGEWFRQVERFHAPLFKLDLQFYKLIFCTLDTTSPHSLKNTVQQVFTSPF